MAITRNESCPCESGKKYKRCCMASGQFEYTEVVKQASATELIARAKAALELGDLDRAIQALESLLKRSKVSSEVLTLATSIEIRRRNFEAARDYAEKTVVLEPDGAHHWYNYGTALTLINAKEEALKAFYRALELKPDFALVYPNLGHTLRDLGRSAEAMECYQKVFDNHRIDLATISQILLSMHLFSATDHEQLFNMHCVLGREIARRNPQVSVQRESFPVREKIRIGYISPRFSREIVGYFFKPLFDHHDRSQYEIYLYNITPRTDELTGYFSERADQWREVGGLSDGELCQQVVDDEIDVLIDLAGHAPENRIAAVARKPAPVQISMLDYFDTTGVKALDYYVTDHFSSPQDSPQKFTESLIVLEQPRLVYEAPDYAPPVKVRESIDEPLVFGSFNRYQKTVSHVIEVWSRLLRAVPNSRLVLKNGPLTQSDLQHSFLEQFAAQGVDASRIEFRGKSPHADMLAEYGDIDIALDTFPYNGGLTTCEALWMGTPVITLLGERIISRQTAGMLHAVELPQFIAETEAEFASIGTYWAENRRELNRIRLGLRERMKASPLTDGVAYTRSFEAHIEKIWSQFLADQS